MRVAIFCTCIVTSTHNHPTQLHTLFSQLLLHQLPFQVDAISLTYTTLTTPTNRQLWYPNEKIRATTFVNLTNSGNAARSLAISLDVDTPAHIPLALLEAAKEVAAQQPKEFDGEPGIVYGAAPEPMRYVLTVYWTLSHPGADLGRAGRVQSAMINAILSRLAQLGARCSAPPCARRASTSQTTSRCTRWRSQVPRPPRRRRRRPRPRGSASSPGSPPPWRRPSASAAPRAAAPPTGPDECIRANDIARYRNACQTLDFFQLAQFICHHPGASTPIPLRCTRSSALAILCQHCPNRHLCPARRAAAALFSTLAYAPP